MALITEVKNDVATLIDLNESAFVWGMPGIGKSEIIHQIAADRGALVTDIRLSAFDPVDLRGMPQIIEGLTHWMRPAIWPNDPNRENIIFFDEMDRGAPAVANAALQIVLDKKIGEHVLPAGTRIVAAGNGSTDRVGTNKISSAQANRFTHLYAEADAEGTAAHLSKKGVHPAMVAFLRLKGAPDHQGNKGLITTTAAAGEHAFASPRQWEKCAKMIMLEPMTRFRLMSGTVGKGPAGEFISFLEVMNELPRPAEIEANPMGAIVPVKPSAVYAVAAMLGARMTKQNANSFVAYASRLDIEFQTMAILDAARRDATVQETAAFIKWHVANPEVTL